MAKKRSKSLFTFATRAQKAASDGMASVGWLKVLKTFSVIFVLVGICVGFWFLDRWRRQVKPTEESLAALKLVEPPSWVNEELKRKIALAALPNRASLKLDENSAAVVEERLRKVAWLTNVVVETSSKGVIISADYRQPVAIVAAPAAKDSKYYLSRDMVVLDYVPMEGLAVVEIVGMSNTGYPVTGQTWRNEDVSAAIDILDKLRRMDRDMVRRGDPPLLPEIESIDVSNLDGRRDAKSPHIILKAPDGTQMLWGARLGMAARHMEANDEEKLVMLYEFFLQPKSAGNKPTLQGRVKYVELRIPRDSIPRPTVPPEAIPN
jgi:hypothetical protein